MMTKKEIFTLSIIDNGNGSISIHATHTGDAGIVLKTGLAIIAQLGGDDSIVETVRAPQSPAPRWVQ